MKNVQYAKNGQLVSAVKELSEMTEAEKNAIRPVDVDRHSAYHVQYNKNGELLHVSGAELTQEVKEESTKPKADMVDAMQVLFNNNKRSKSYQQAKKRLNVSNEQINRARRVIAND